MRSRTPISRAIQAGSLCLTALVAAPVICAQAQTEPQPFVVPGGPIAIISLDNKNPDAAPSVTGGSQVSAGKAIIAASGTVTSGNQTTDVILPHRGVLRVCASTTVKLAADSSVPDGETPGLMMAFDHGAVEASFATGRNSDILLTPYSAENTIDADALGAFIRKEYADAKVDPDEIDTGALILTGVAVQRKNARAIGELFAKEAGKLVAVSAGDSLETVMAAYGSGAVARSIRDECTVMNIDVGGGTSKIAVCVNGKVVTLTAADIGARLNYDPSDAAMDSVMDTLWQTALRLEEGDRPAAERAVD